MTEVNENGLYMSITPDMGNIIDRLKERKWIISFFDTTEDKIYNPAIYRYNVECDNCNYILVPDRNIISYILDSSNEKRVSQNSRDAIGLILFCQIANIVIEPNLAMHEYISFNKDNIEKALDEIELFRNIDSYSDEAIMDYAMGRIDYLPNVKPLKIDERVELSDEISKITWLKEWDYFYLVVLKLISINKLDINNETKRFEFINWMSNEARLSTVAFIYSMYLFSRNKVRGMIKYKENDSHETQRAAVKNMTWDLYYINSGLRLYQSKKENQEYVFVSNDNVLKMVFGKLVQVAYKELDAIKDLFTHKEFLGVKGLYEFTKTNPKSAYRLRKWSNERRQMLIAELEEELFKE